MRQWRIGRFGALFFALVGMLILLSNGMTQRPFDWWQVPILLGMIAFAFALVELARRWFNFMLGSCACLWWWQS